MSTSHAWVPGSAICRPGPQPKIALREKIQLCMYVRVFLQACGHTCACIRSRTSTERWTGLARTRSDMTWSDRAGGKSKRERERERGSSAAPLLGGLCCPLAWGGSWGVNLDCASRGAFPVAPAVLEATRPLPHCLRGPAQKSPPQNLIAALLREVARQ